VRAILLIDHGSVKPEANHMVSCMANLLQHFVGDSVLVRHAHMELAEPSIAAGFAACVAAGATEVIAFPYMLSPGKHRRRERRLSLLGTERSGGIMRGGLRRARVGEPPVGTIGVT
jgi:hypothetical protein